MNERIKELYIKAGLLSFPKGEEEVWLNAANLTKFAESIIQECEKRNRKQSYELAGVIIDVARGVGFDSVCLDTVERVEHYLLNNGLTEHFKETYIDPNRDQTL